MNSSGYGAVFRSCWRILTFHLHMLEIVGLVAREQNLMDSANGTSRSGVRARRRRKKLGPQLVQAGRSLVAFLLGLLLAFIYGLLGFLLQKQPLRFCVNSTLILAGLTAFGMGLSVGLRASVMVMLPTLFSGESEAFT